MIEFEIGKRYVNTKTGNKVEVVKVIPKLKKVIFQSLEVTQNTANHKFGLYICQCGNYEEMTDEN